MKIGILGTGAYGLSLGMTFHENGCSVTQWTKFIEEKNQLEKKRKDDTKLPGIKIPQEIKFTNDLKDVVINQDLIVIAIPAGFVNDVVKEISPLINKNQSLCIASKGIENNTCAFLTEVIARHIKTKKIAVISGPSFAIDIVSKVPIGLSLATKNKETEYLLKNTLQNNHLKLRTTSDLIGIELCGAIKNVVALAAGMLDGMNLPESTKAMFITESLHDIKELIKKLGGSKKTILSFAGFGDLLLTCTSTKSRNFCYGKLIGEGKSKKDLEKYQQTHTIEGIYTLKSIHQLINNKHIDIPIISLIYDIVFHEEDCNKLLSLLITK